MPPCVYLSRLLPGFRHALIDYPLFANGTKKSSQRDDIKPGKSNHPAPHAGKRDKNTTIQKAIVQTNASPLANIPTNKNEAIATKQKVKILHNRKGKKKANRPTIRIGGVAILRIFIKQYRLLLAKVKEIIQPTKQFPPKLQILT